MQKFVKLLLLSVIFLLTPCTIQAKEYEIGPQTSCCQQGSFEISADFLYWTADFHFPAPILLSAQNEENTFSEGVFTIDFSQEAVSFKTHQIHQKWSPGFRVGLGWNTDCDCWDVQAFWTYFHNHSQKEITSNDSNIIFPDADASLHFNYNVVDLELGKTILNRSVLFRPFFGLRGGWIKQDSSIAMRDNFATFTLDNQSLTINQTVDVNLDQNTWAIGPRMGLDTTWGDYCGFSLFANVSTSLLYGNGKSDLSVAVVAVDGEPSPGTIDMTEVSVSIHDRAWTLSPTVQMLIGVSWSQELCGAHLKLNAVWESTYWWNALNVVGVDSIAGATIGKAISLQGLTIHSSVSY